MPQIPQLRWYMAAMFCLATAISYIGGILFTMATGCSRTGVPTSRCWRWPASCLIGYALLSALVDELAPVAVRDGAVTGAAPGA